ncbi:hypothetical protein ACFL6P_00570 [Candidatus Latescibacterota bacterium]
MNKIINFLPRLPKTTLIAMLAALVLFCPACSLMKTGTPADNLTGNWEGSITIPDGTVLQLFLEFYTNADGDYGAFLKVPQQTENSISVQDITLDKKEVTFNVEEVQATFKGAIESNDMFKGAFTQGGQLMPVVFNRAK